jgi:hypothetical protein
MTGRDEPIQPMTPNNRAATMKIGPVDVKTVDECLDVLEDCFQSPMWKELPQEEKIRLIGRLSYILEVTEKQELGG